MAINTNKQIGAFFYGNAPMILNSNPNPTTSYGQIAGKTAVNITAADLEGLTTLPSDFQQNNSNLQTVVLPGTITSWAGGNGGNFRSCANLVSVKFDPNSTIAHLNGNYNFCQSPKLKELIFPNSVQTFGPYFVEAGATNLKKVVLGTGITGSGLNFKGATNIEAFIILKTSVAGVIPYGYTPPANWVIYVVDADTQTAYAAATNWNTRRIELLHTIYLDGIAHYIAADPTKTIQVDLVKGYLADMESKDLTATYDWFTDSTYTSAADLTATYIDGLVLYGKTKTQQGEE